MLRLAKDEMLALENISNGIRDLNINHYQSSSSLVDSIHDLSSASMNSNRNLKAILELQEKNNQLLVQILDKLLLEKKLAKWQEKVEPFNPWPGFVDLFASVIMVVLMFMLVLIVNISYYSQFKYKIAIQVLLRFKNQHL